MKTNLRGRDFISTQEWTKEELETVLQLAFDLKMKWGLDLPTRLLEDKTLFMLFFFSSTRTRNSFEAGMTRLGGHAIFLEPDKMQISHGDTPKEIGKILSSYGHGIAIRHCDWGDGNKYLRDVAEHARIPVINMQCDIYHPCQAMADLMTCIEKKGDLRGKKVVMSWAYAKSYTKPLSLPQSVIELFTQFGADVTLAHPPEFALMPERTYESWICDERRMALAKEDAIYMHCLPADRGVEVTDAVIDGPQSVVYDQAENRMHVQNAIMALIMGGR